MRKLKPTLLIALGAMVTAAAYAAVWSNERGVSPETAAAACYIKYPEEECRGAGCTFKTCPQPVGLICSAAPCPR